jgi:hypothetical protein
MRMLALAVLLWPSLVLARDPVRPAMVTEASSSRLDASAGLASLASSSLASLPRRANFIGAVASPEARRVADWVVASADNAGLPFIIIDKIRATVFVFDKAGQLRGASLALLGRAHGDNSVPGIGKKKLSAISPDERTTPAGRFVAFLGVDFQHDVLWIDYATSLSLHRVVTGNPGDHRLQRLATTSVIDKRISYGCVNVPVKFYEEIVLTTFAHTTGIVYILPEVKTIGQVFAIGGSTRGVAGNLDRQDQE